MSATIPSSVREPKTWQRLQDLDERGENLTQWEIEFVESLMKQLRGGSFCSNVQRMKLADICAERLPEEG